MRATSFPRVALAGGAAKMREHDHRAYQQIHHYDLWIVRNESKHGVTPADSIERLLIFPPVQMHSPLWTGSMEKIAPLHAIECEAGHSQVFQFCADCCCEGFMPFTFLPSPRQLWRGLFVRTLKRSETLPTTGNPWRCGLQEGSAGRAA